MQLACRAICSTVPHACTRVLLKRSCISSARNLNSLDSHFLARTPSSTFPPKIFDHGVSSPVNIAMTRVPAFLRLATWPIDAFRA